MTFPVKFSIVLFLGLLLFQARANPSPKEKCQALIEAAVNATDRNEFGIAIKKLGQAEIVMGENHWPDKMWHIKNVYGISYAGLSNYGKALKYFNKAMDIVEDTPKLTKNKLSIVNNVALVFVYKKEYQKAITYYKSTFQSVKIFHSSSEYEQLMKKVLGVNLASLYNEIGQYDKGRKILMETASIQTRKDVMQLWQVTYTENLFLRGHTEEALRKAQKMYKETLEKKKKFAMSASWTCYQRYMPQRERLKKPFFIPIKPLPTILSGNPK